MPSRYALGWAIGFPGPLDSSTLFGMAGSGGTAAYADPASGIAVAVMKNRVTHGTYDAFHDLGGIVAQAVADDG